MRKNEETQNNGRREMATLKDVKRIVIKVGTSTLTHSTGKTNIRRMKALVAVISDIVNSGIDKVSIYHRAVEEEA